jgi:hypothetical protein
MLLKSNGSLNKDTFLRNIEKEYERNIEKLMV